MRRRHLLALVILALVVATVLAMGPVKVWDSLTLRDVQRSVITTDGSKIAYYRVRLWDETAPLKNAVGVATFRDRQGITIRTQRRLPDGRVEFQQWERGELRGMFYFRILDGGWPPDAAAVQSRTGVFWWADGTYVIDDQGDRVLTEDPVQVLYKNGVIVERRWSSPWFTDIEILDSVEGVKE